MRKIKIKLMSILLITCLILQLFASIIAFAADIPSDLTGETDYLVVHNTSDGYPDFGGASSITVKTPEGDEILPDGNVYSDVPAGSTIELNYAFHLENDDGEGEVYSYTGDNYLDITLPEGISFVQPSSEQEIIATDNTDPDNPLDWTLGTWYFTDNNTIRVDLSDKVSEHSYMWGEIYIDGVFNALENEEEQEVNLVLGSEEIIFYREVPLPPEIELDKEGIYDPTSNEITWTVTVIPPDDTDLEGYSLVDVYSSNQTYKPDSFLVEDSNISDDNLDLSEDSQVIYTFPDNTVGNQTVTYKTIPDSFSNETGDGNSTEYTTFENTAYINYGDEEITEPVEAEVTVDWISKSGNTITTSDDSVIIEWTVDITVPNDGQVTGASITDTIPEGLILLNDEDYKVHISINESNEEIVSEGDGAGTYDYNDVNNVMTYYFPSSDGVEGQLEKSATLTYYTKVIDKDQYLNSNQTIKFTNNVDFSWNEMPDPANPPEDIASVNVKGYGGLISKSAGSAQNFIYPGYIHWSITVNRNGISINDAIVTDSIEEGQKLLIDTDHPFTVKQSGSEIYQTTSSVEDSNFSSDDGFNRNYSYNIGDTTDTYTLDYYTQIIDADSENADDNNGLDTLYDNNDDVRFNNETVLSRSGDATVSTSGTKSYKSLVVTKSVADGYNYSDHTVKWKIIVNRNQLPLTNAKLVDDVPEDMVLIIDEDHPFKVMQNGNDAIIADGPTIGESGNISFEYHFEENINDEYTIIYYTHLEDDALLTQWYDKNFENEAVLYADEIINEGIEASATAKISNPVVTKTYYLEDNADHIDWSVIINPSKINLIGASVKDELNEALELDTESLKLYEVDITADGTVLNSSEGILLTDGYEVTLPTEENNNTLTVDLPEDSYSVYRLEFTTYILTDDIDIENSVSLSGSSNSPSGDASAGRIVVNDLWSNAGSGSHSLTVHKEDGKGNPVHGATYELLNRNYQPVKKNNVPITAVTDENGDALFSNLPSWTLYAKEVNPPDGYLINENAFGGNKLIGNLTYNTSNDLAVGDIVFAKTSSKGSIINGGEFTLVGTDYEDNMITSTSTSVKGVVTFENIPLGSYTITETKAPSGYYLTDEEISAEITYNDDKTDVIVNVSPDTIENKAKPNDDDGNSYGSIKLKKTDSTGDALSGAEFGLYNTSGNLVKSVVSKANGIVEFKNVVYGKYTIREISSPEGYDISDVESIAEVSSSDQDVSADPYIIVDYKTDEIIPENPNEESEIQIKKIDSVSKIPLAGAQFALYNYDGLKVQTATSGNNGIALFTDVEKGTYSIKETAAPKGYILGDSRISVVVDDNNTYEFTVENMAKDGTNPVDPNSETPKDEANPVDPNSEMPTDQNDKTPEDSGSNSDNSSTSNNTSGNDVLPQTGGLLDTSTLGLLGALMIALGLGIAYLRWRKFR